MAVLRCSACVRDISAREGGGVPCPLPRNKKLLWMRRPPPAEMSGLLVRAHASRAQSSHPQLPIYPSPLEALCPAWRAVGKVGRRECCTSPRNIRRPAPELTIASTYSRSISSVSSLRQSPRVGGGCRSSLRMGRGLDSGTVTVPGQSRTDDACDGQVAAPPLLPAVLVRSCVPNAIARGSRYPLSDGSSRVLGE